MHDEQGHKFLLDLLASVEEEKRLIGEQKAINERLISLEIKKRSLISELMAQFAPLDTVPSSNGTISAPRGEFKTHHDWIIELMKTCSDGLSEEGIVKCLAPRIKTKAKDRDKAVRDALSLLVRSGRIQKSNGIYRLTGMH